MPLRFEAERRNARDASLSSRDRVANRPSRRLQPYRDPVRAQVLLDLADREGPEVEDRGRKQDRDVAVANGFDEVVELD